MEENEAAGDSTKPPDIDAGKEGETIFFEEKSVFGPTHQSEDMEVHTHSHTQRTKWSHYFWEFLMLFLAVFCGFLAEYKLEHVIENQREVKLMQSLGDDLQADEVTLKNYADWRKAVNQDFDSLLLLLSKPGFSGNEYSIYQKSKRSALRFGLPDIHEGTIQQLKNAGGLRLVREKEVLKAINTHYLKIARMKSTYDIEVLLRVRLSETMGEVLDARLWNMDTNPPPSFSFITDDGAKINSFMHSIIAAKEINQRLIIQLDSALVSTVRLEQLIGQAYPIH